MGLLDRLKQKKDGTTEVEFTNEENATIDDVVEFIMDEGKAITREVAEKISALNNGIALISDSVATLPIYLYKRNLDGSRDKVNDYRNKLLNMENSEHSTSFNLKKNLVSDFLYHGNGYVDIERASGEIVALRHIPYKDIKVEKTNNENKRQEKYRYSYWEMNNPFHDVINLARNTKKDEITGIGILEEGKRILSSANHIEEYTNNIFNNGFFAKGVIESEKMLTKKSRESLSERVKKFFSGSKNAGKVMILDDGMKYKALGLSPSDVNLLQQKDFTINDIARLLKIQPSLIGGKMEGLVYSNQSDNQLNFLQMTLGPILKLIENTFNKYLLTEEEKSQGYFFEFSTTDMLRCTPEKEIKMYTDALKGSLYTINEARGKINRKPIEGGDRPLIMSGMCIISEDGTIIGPNSEKLKEDMKGGDNNEQ